MIDRCGPSGRRIQNYVGCKALPLYGAREESFRAVRRSGSGDRSAGDSVRDLFAPQLQLDEREIQKPSVFGGVLFHISFAVERNMAAGGIHAGRGRSPQSENGKRAVGDAGPYGVRDRRHGEIRVGGVCPLGAFKRGTRERVAGRDAEAIPCGTFLHRSYNWTKGKSKNRWFLAAFFSIFLSLLKEIWPPEANAGRGCSPQSENGKRAVGDAGPYGVRDRRHDEIRVGGVCPLGAVKRGTRERVAFSGRL